MRQIGGLEGREEKGGKRVKAVFEYVWGLQLALIWGATVQMTLGASSVRVVSVEVGSHWLEVGYVTSASSHEQFVAVPLSTTFTLAFEDYPQEVVGLGWGH